MYNVQGVKMDCEIRCAAPISGRHVPEHMLGTRAALFHLLKVAGLPNRSRAKPFGTARKERAKQPCAQSAGWAGILHEDQFIFKAQA